MLAFIQLCRAAKVGGKGQLTLVLADMEVCQESLGAQSPHRAVRSVPTCKSRTRLPSVSRYLWSATWQQMQRHPRQWLAAVPAP